MPDPWGDGGARRTAQIGEVLNRAALVAPFLKRPQAIGKLGSLAGFVVEAGFLRRSRMPLRLRWELIKVLGRDIPNLRRQLASLPAGSCLLWEATGPEYAYLPRLAGELGIRVIGLPHNLEALVPQRCSFGTGRAAPAWLAEELRSLGACDAVYAISREDQWLLRVHGIDADYLPYFPPTAVECFLREVRGERTPRQGTDELLLLGTAANPPTLAGMRDRLKFFHRHRRLFGRLHVAGFGTDRLRAEFSGDAQIILHGAVDRTTLRHLLLGARAAVVHQQPTSGALTRIPELLLAGVPVLANVDAARSCFGMPGVRVYENDEQLRALLLAPALTFEPPVRALPLEQAFCGRVSSPAGGEGR